MSARLSIFSRKIFLAGKGLSFRTGKYFGEAMLVGATTGFVVVAFRYMIDFAHRWLMDGIGGHERLGAIEKGCALSGFLSLEEISDPARWTMVFLPAVGALAGYLLIKRFSSVEHVRGTDSAIRAYHHRDGYITGTVIPVKSVASVLTVGSGGSAGYEGPVTLVGAAVGSVISRRLNLTVRARRILMAAGLSAGIAALFQSPLAGALFGFEVFYSSSDVEYETLLPCFIASAVSYTVFAYFFGWGSLIEMPVGCAYDSGLRLLPYLVLAFAVTFGARFYIHFFRKSEMKFATLRAPRWTKVAIGGLLTGISGFFFPDILGPGYSIIRSAFSLSGDASATCSLSLATGFLALFFIKAVTTSFTVGSGGSGGLFAPALVCGGALGASVGIYFSILLPPSMGISPAAFALVGMAGFVASSIRVPLTAIVMVAEISGNHDLLLPAMWVCGVSFWLNNGWSLYRSQVHCRESSPVHERISQT